MLLQLLAEEGVQALLGDNAIDGLARAEDLHELVPRHCARRLEPTQTFKMQTENSHKLQSKSWQLYIYSMDISFLEQCRGRHAGNTRLVRSSPDRKAANNYSLALHRFNTYSLALCCREVDGHRLCDFQRKGEPINCSATRAKIRSLAHSTRNSRNVSGITETLRYVVTMFNMRIELRVRGAKM